MLPTTTASVTIASTTQHHHITITSNKNLDHHYNKCHHRHEPSTMPQSPHPPVCVDLREADQRCESVVVRVAVHFLAGLQDLGEGSVARMCWRAGKLMH